MANQLKAVHDRLLAQKPEGAEHDSTGCALCAMDAADEPTTTERGGSPMADFTQEQVDSMIAVAVSKAIEDATGPLQSRIVELEASKQTDEIEAAVADATATLSTEAARLQSELDAANVAKTAAETALADLEAARVQAEADREEAERVSQLKDKRIEEATAAAVLDEDYIKEHADRFAAMSDEDWAFNLDEWKLIASKTGTTKRPVTTAIHASRGQGADPRQSSLHLIGEIRRGEADASKTA